MDKKTAVIYLASGNSKRFGEENKLLKKIGTKPMYRYGLDRLVDICKSRENCEIVVVTQYEEIIKEAYESIVRTTFCPESKYGISWSIKAGIKATERCRLLCIFRSRPARYEKRDNRRISLFYGRWRL